jgi:hypothetical protein
MNGGFDGHNNIYRTPISLRNGARKKNIINTINRYFSATYLESKYEFKVL